MDKKDIRYSYLNYFRNQIAHNQLIDVKTLLDIAGNPKIAKEVLNELVNDGLVEGVSNIQGDDNSLGIDSAESIKLTEKGIKELDSTSLLKRLIEDKKQDKEESNLLNQLMKSNNTLKPIIDNINSINLENTTLAKQLAELSKIPAISPEVFEYYNSPAFRHLAENIQEIQKAMDISDIISEDTKKQNKGTKKAPQNIKESNNDESYTFEGILGQNCGEVVPTTGEDEKRIQIKGFKIKDGIRILRGFAKSSILAEYSKPDNNYQRNENNNHLNSLKSFMQDIKTSAKYLPEVTLVARGYQKLEPIKLSGKLSDTQQGELENLEYWKLTVNKEQLFRIDGNHRLEATKDKDYYIPFSIIIWENNPNSADDEAFLFYFLNSKAKKLETEENLKGLVDAETWNDKELEKANILLPYIRHFKHHFEDHKLFNKTYYKDKNNNENAKTQILNVLEVIQKETNDLDLPFDIEAFEEYIKNTQDILSQKERFKYLRKQFRNFPQFVFYTLYKKNGDVEEALRFINATNKWAEFYKHDSNSFIYPNKMFHNAEKQLGKKINIFVAMPYYDEETVEQFNNTFNSMIEEIKKEEEWLAEKVNLYAIMKYKAESTDILANMDKQIGECDIFIADISNHGKNKVNPNVMFELGRVYDKKNFILIRNKKNKISNSAFDIQHIDYVPINYDVGFDTSIKKKLKPRILNMIKNIIGFC